MRVLGRHLLLTAIVLVLVGALVTLGVWPLRIDSSAAGTTVTVDL
jgi:hypothetical protein